MPRPRSFDSAAVDALLRANDSVATHAELKALGMPMRTISNWVNHGPWQRPFPGLVIGYRGPISRRHWRRAALAYCGPEAAISGEHALDLHGITGNRITIVDQVLVEIPWRNKRSSSGLLIVERSERAPTITIRQGFRVVSPARAAADAARHGADEDRIRELFGAVLHQNRCTVEELREEVFGGPTQRTNAARRVLLEVSAGIRSAGEGKLFQVISTSGLPQPLWNEDIVVNGRLLAQADAWWPQFRVVVELDGIRWHSTPEDIRRTQAKQRRYAAAGILLITIAPADLLADPDGFLRQLAAVLDLAGRRSS